MTARAFPIERKQLVASTFALASLAVLALAVFTGLRPQVVAPLTALFVLLMVTWRTILGWRSIVTITMLLIFFIPIKRYEIPASLPFKLEPYRIFIGVVALGWIASLLVDPRVRLRKGGLEAPLLLIGFAITASLVMNPGRVGALSSEVQKTVIFFASFFVVFYLTESTTRRFRDVEFVVKWLVGAGAVIGVFALVERRTNYNAFNHLQEVLPLQLNPEALPPENTRGGRLRVSASAGHPIELGATLALLIPFALYAVYATRQLRWVIAAVLIVVAMLSTGSRTAVVMLAVIMVVFFLHRPREIRRMWPALIPVALAIHFAAPGTIGTLRASFTPEGGLIAEQKSAPIGNARLATLGPTLRNEWAPRPIFGTGFATRITTSTPTVSMPNAPILDNQWLGVLAETGLVGAIAWAWMFTRYIRRAGSAARRDPTARGWLLLATTASVAAYAVGMLTYDAFSFIQVTFLLFIVLGLGCAALLAEAPEPTTALVGRERAGTLATRRLLAADGESR